MMSFKQFSASLVAVAAAAAVAPAMAANTYTSAITIDSATVTANLSGYAVGTVGSATYDSTSGLLTEPVTTVTTANVTLDSASGLKFTKSFSPTITLSGFSIDEATGELYGSMAVTSGIITVLNIANQSVLQATSVTNTLANAGGVLDLSNFVLSTSFQNLLANTYNINPANYTYLASLVKDVKITNTTKAAVPEPSTYALMGLGLVGMGLVARRKQQA